MAADSGVAAHADAIRADTDGHRGVHAVGLLSAAGLLAARILAAALAGILAAAVLLAAAVVRPEQAAARESRRERSGRDRNLNRLRDDLVHSAPPFFVSREEPFYLGVATMAKPDPPDTAHYELFPFRCLLEKQRKR